MRADLFYRNPRLTALAAGLIVVAGVAALSSLPRQEDPTLSRRFGTITTFYPGANALRVESLVTEKIEAHLQELHEIASIDSLSRTGVSVIQLELGDAYDEAVVDEVWSKVRDKLGDAAAELPPGARAPEFEDRTSTAVTILAALVWEGEGAPPGAVMTRLARELENRLRNLAGTRRTELHGAAAEEIRVEVDPEVLAAVDLTAGQVSAAIARADAKLPAGQLRAADRSWLLEVAGELDSLQRIREVPLRRETDGRLLRVGDVARVEKTAREPAASLALVHGRPAVVVAATMETERRVDRWAEAARGVLSGFAAEVPRGIGFETIFDQSVYTGQRLGTLVRNLLLGAAVVMAVLLVSMGIRSALVVASALPLTLLAVLAELAVLGVPLHQISITGLILALGLLIDNAIVVVDEYDSRRRTGLAPGEAIARVVRHFFRPLLASTVTTVLAFLPIVLMPGPAGEFVGTISVAVGLAVTTSFGLSMTVIPALAGCLSGFERAHPSGSGPWWRSGFSDPRLTAVYRRSLVAVLRRPSLGVAVSLVLPLLGFAAGRSLSEQFFPANDRDQFQVQLVLPEQASLEQTRRAALRAREIIHRREEVRASHWFVGEAAPRVYYNMFNNEDGQARFAGAFVDTVSAEATDAVLPGLQAELTRSFPEARVVALPFEQGPPFEAPIEVRLFGPDLERLRALGEEVRRVLATTGGVTFTAAKLSGGEPVLLVRADEDEVRLAGLSLRDVAGQLDARLEGAVGGSLIEATEEIPVRVRVGEGARASVVALASGRVLPPVAAAAGGSGAAPDVGPDVAGVPLAAVSELALVPRLAGVSRRNGERVNTVQAYLVPYTLIADSLAEFQRRLDASGFTLPAGYRLELGGESAERSEALGNLAAFALPLFVLMAGVIILTFDSFRRAAIIFAVAGLSVGLALFGVWLFGHPLGFVAIVGTMGLVGLAINDAIVVLTALRSDPRAAHGDPEDTAEVVIGATRHILATTFTTMGGFAPLIAFGGRFWPPMATAIAGGVAGASILALYFVPSLYVAIARRDAARRP